MTEGRIPMQTLMRAACVSLLEQYKAELADMAPAPPKLLQIYRARPRTVAPPSAWVDAIREDLEHTGIVGRVVLADVVIAHGLFDSGEAADNRDKFVDGFIDWTLDDPHALDGNTTLAIVSVEDLPAFVPEWVAPAEQRTYYATQFTFRGEGWTA